MIGASLYNYPHYHLWIPGGALGGVVLALLINMFIKMNKQEEQSISNNTGNIKKCPFCANDIKKEAIVCQFCGKDLSPEESGEKHIETVNNIPDSKKDGQAIVSLISGVMGLSLLPVIGSIVGIIMGILGLNSTKRKMAIAGLVISIIGLIIVIGAIYFISIEWSQAPNLRIEVPAGNPNLW